MENDVPSYTKTVGIIVGITAFSTLLTGIYYSQLSGRHGTIVLPAGNTYLGPNVTRAPQPSSTFTVSDDAAWHTIQGHIYPYTLSVPESLTLITFPDDPFDMYGISWGGITPISNVLIGVDDLTKDAAKSQYINQPKSVYVRSWWKQFTSLTGVSSVETFTNANGLKGYRVKYLNGANKSPNLDIFFEVPGNPQYVIHLTSGVLDPAVFAKIIDSVTWAPVK